MRKILVLIAALLLLLLAFQSTVTAKKMSFTPIKQIFIKRNIISYNASTNISLWVILFCIISSILILGLSIDLLRHPSDMPGGIIYGLLGLDLSVYSILYAIACIYLLLHNSSTPFQVKSKL